MAIATSGAVLAAVAIHRLLRAAVMTDQPMPAAMHAIAGYAGALEVWTYAGVREDDPADVIPHEDRRDLRGADLTAAHRVLSHRVRDALATRLRRAGVPRGAIALAVVGLLVNLICAWWLKDGHHHHHEHAHHAHAPAPVAPTAPAKPAGADKARVRIQLSPGVEPSSEMDARFTDAIAAYTGNHVEITCERYESFVSGMSLDYERKFPYLKK